MKTSQLAFALAAGLAAFQPMSVRAEDTVVATVNGKSITDKDMALAESEIGGDLGSYTGTVRKRILIEYLIENELFSTAAEAEKLGSGPDFEKRMAYWKSRTLRDLYFDTKVKGAVAEADARKLYDERVGGMKPEEEVHARHILVDSEDKANGIFAELGKGGDFADLAKKNSSDPGSKDNGGDLGFFGRGQMVPEFEQAAFALGKGEVSKPVKSQFGWHVIKLEEKREKKPPTYEEVKDRILGSLVQSKAQEIATGLRGKAKIDYIDPDVKKQVEDEAAKKAGAPAQP